MGRPPQEEIFLRLVVLVERFLGELVKFCKMNFSSSRASRDTSTLVSNSLQVANSSDESLQLWWCRKIVTLTTPNPTCAKKAILAMNKINLTFTLVALIREISSSPKGFAKKEGGGGNLKEGVLTPLSTSTSLLGDDFLLKKEGEGIEKSFNSFSSISTSPLAENFDSSFTKFTIFRV